MWPRRETSPPTIIASTASPYKFAASVLEALEGRQEDGDEFAMIGQLSAVSGTPVPAPIAALQGKELRFSNVCKEDGMKEVVLNFIRS